MRLPQQLGTVLLAIWVLLFNLVFILGIVSVVLQALIALLGAVAGGVMLWERRADLRPPA